eukprot:TRINITY_DN68_c0_g1_i1.p1 TRINITY_DN68_c0_g1~~TRINITY_DN68_c0_g1_i1.p1  ORF type:complete len:266 (-),score=31.14 TRINITY_DN68_c0_g1_i1:202-999(-)
MITDPSSEEKWLSRGIRSRSSQKHLCAPVSFGDICLFKSWLGTSTTVCSSIERDVLIHKMALWLKENDRVYYGSHLIEDIHNAIGDILDIITNLIGMLKTPTSMLAVIILYADRFVKHSGIKHNQLFNLLLTSSVVTVKFWNESVIVSNRNMAQLFEFSLADLNLMENRFLLGVEYTLCLNVEDVKNFLITIENEFRAATTEIKFSLPSIPSDKDSKSLVHSRKTSVRGNFRAEAVVSMNSKGNASPSVIVTDSFASVSIVVSAQ